MPKVLPTDPDAIRDIYNAASFATADHTWNSEEAEAFVAELKAMTLAYEARNHPRGRARRKTDDEAFKMAIAAFAADLVRHSSNEASYGFMYRPADREELAQTLMSSDALKKLRTYWIPLDLLEESGFTHFSATIDDDDRTANYKKVRRFRATHCLLDLARNHGITPDNISEHFLRSHRHAQVLQVRAKKKSDYLNPTRGKLIPRKGPRFESLRKDVETLNRYLDRHTFSLTDKPMLRRVFNCGDRDGFDYNLGGRFYAASDDDWMQKPKEERRDIQIDGEPTCELDVSASQLGILCALQDKTLNQTAGPYHIEGIPRDVVKGIIVATIGGGAFPTRWPRSFNDRFHSKHGYHPRDRFTLKAVIKQIASKHPILYCLEPDKLDWANLQFEEAECFRIAMKTLHEEYSVPSLPVHDSLIVRRRDYERTAFELQRVYRERFGYAPTVTMDDSTLDVEDPDDF